MHAFYNILARSLDFSQKQPNRLSGGSRKTKFHVHKAKLNVHNPAFSKFSGCRVKPGMTKKVII